jgi:hypothetical protein
VFTKDEDVKGREQREGGENPLVSLETEWRIRWEGWSRFPIANSPNDEAALDGMFDNLHLGQNEGMVPVC